MTRISVRKAAPHRTSSAGKRAALQRGVFFPLAALTILVVLTFVLILGLRVLLIKQAAADFRYRANLVCANLVNSDLFIVRRRALEAFKQMLDAQFNNPENPLSPPGFVHLTEVRLSIPDMPGDSVFDPIGGSSAPPYLEGGGDEPGAGSELPFAALGLPSCLGIAGLEQDCVFSAAADQQRFPETLWNNLEHAGQAAGCFFRGEVRVFFDWTGAVTPVEASYGYWRPVRGRFPAHNPGAPVVEEYPGLTLAVSTHMTTDSSLSRFRFPAQDRWVLDDPLHGFVGLPAGYPNMYEHDTIPACSGSHCTAVPEKISVRFQSAEWPDAQPGHERDHGTGGPPDYVEMRAACANPATLVRNAFLSTIVELAGRHGQLRSSLEVLHVGTQHRDASAAALPARSGLPTIIVPFGADLLRPDLTSGLADGSYQLPYVAFYGGKSDGSDSPAEFGRPLGGYVNPFSDSGLSTALQQQMALVAEQLRICYHLYQCSYSFDASSPQCPPQQISRIYPLNLYNPPFESADYEPVAALCANDRGTANAAWDQRCPWGGQGCASGGGSSGRPRSAGLTAAEVVAALGTTQLCPYRHYSAGLTPPLCEKPKFDGAALVTADLRPDYRALLHYLSGSASAVKSPGLWPLRGGYVWPQNNGQPFAPEQYQTARNKHTPLLLVTHQPPGEQEAEAVYELLSSSDEWRQRPIIVLFIPSGIVEAGGLARLEYAFRARSDGNDGQYHNTVYVLSPYGEGVSRWDMKDPDRDFQEYWLELVSPGAALREDQSIMWRALRIFNQLILKNERKF